jgi:hypothetical protein
LRIGFLIVFLCNHGSKKTWENVVSTCVVERRMVGGSAEKGPVKGSLAEGYKITPEGFLRKYE